MNNNLYFFNRSEEGLLEQLNESLKIIEISLVLAERFGIKAFYKVIAAQLRVIIADTLLDRENNRVINNSLAYKLYGDEMMLAKVKENSILFDHSEHDIVKCNDLFDLDREGIPLHEWLNQPVIHTGPHPITVQKLIKYYSNKHGGTHVDEEIPGQAVFLGAVGEDYLCAIAWYVLASFKGDVDEKLLQDLLLFEDQINEISEGI